MWESYGINQLWCIGNLAFLCIVLLMLLLAMFVAEDSKRGTKK